MKIGLMGDVMIGRGVNETNPPSIWGDVLPLLEENDLNLINLEAALTKRTKEVPKVFNFKADPERVSWLKPIDVVNLANNHILDYGAPGLLETLETLDEAQIQYVGAGRNLEEASQPVITERRGIRIGILGCTDNEPSWKAGRGPGTRYLTVEESMDQDVQRLKEQVDIVILSIHWGPNMRERPIEAFQDFAHRAIDAGVDILHGHSAHIFQGVEIYKHGLILYDTGDFVDDYMIDPVLRNDRSFLFIVDVTKKGVKSLRLVPVRIANCQVHLEKNQEASQRMQMLSKEFGTVITDNLETNVVPA